MTTLTREPVTLYWMPGCSSCLRMKEFVEGTGIPYEAINVEEQPEPASTILAGHGIRVPAICVGDACVNGVRLGDVAALLGVEHVEPERLAPAVLVERYRVVMAALRRMALQLTPEAAATTMPHRRRDLAEVVGHAACTMRYLLGVYDDADFPDLFDELEPGPEARGVDDLIAYLDETLRRVERWWEGDGRHDELDDVVTLYWGSRTLHEALEREVWHAAQHTRQVALMLERAGIEPDGPLRPEDVAGLPLPERVFD